MIPKKHFEYNKALKTILFIEEFFRNSVDSDSDKVSGMTQRKCDTLVSLEGLQPELEHLALFGIEREQASSSELLSNPESPVVSDLLRRI